MLAANGHEPDLKHQHDLLLANCLAQSEALMKGRTLDEAQAQMLRQGHAARPRSTHRAAPRLFRQPAVDHACSIDQLDPYALGRLIALYEHRVFVEGALFGINSFDQWGVELGKELATELLPVVEGKQKATNRDASTAGLVARIAALRGKGQEG